MSRSLLWMRLLVGFLLAPVCFGAPARTPVIAEVSAKGAPLELDLETQAGKTLDEAAIQRDVRALWRTQLYSDVRVSFDPANGSVAFDLQPAPHYRLRSVVFEPRSDQRQLELEAGAEVDRATARRMADELRGDLRRRGFRDARVRAELIPVEEGKADIVIRVDAGRKVRVLEVNLDGPLRKHAKSLRPTPFLPGWSLSKAYTNERLAESLTGIRSALLREGRFEASVAPIIEEAGDNRIEVGFDIERGPRPFIESALVTALDGSRLDLTGESGAFPAKTLCQMLFQQRAASEKEGRLDFSASLEIRPLPPLPGTPHRAMAAAAVRASEPFWVRQIRFEAPKSIREMRLRKALKIEEAELLDSGRLRRSIARLNRFSFLQPVSESDVKVTQVGPAQADIVIRVRKHNARRWTVGGPLGPISLFGPFHGGIETRLPAWGRGLLELSTYTIGGWLTSVPELVLKNDEWVWKTIWKPSLMLSRPAMPGAAWTTGYVWSPQLGLRQVLAANAAMRLRSGLGSLLEGRPPEPPLRVAVTHVERGPVGDMACEPERSWTRHLRTAGQIAFAVAGL